MSCRICVEGSLNLAEVIHCNNLLPLCNRETLVYDLRNVPGTFAQIVEVPNLFKGVDVIDIRTKWFGNFRRFELSRVSLAHGSQNWFELSGVSRNRGWIYRARVKQIQGKQGLTQNIGRFGKTGVREIGIPLYCSFLSWFGHDFSARQFFVCPQSPYRGKDMIFCFSCCHLSRVLHVTFAICKNLDWSFIWGHHHLHFKLVDDRLTNRLLHYLLHRADETRQDRSSCLRLQFLAFSLDYHVVFLLSFLHSTVKHGVQQWPFLSGVNLAVIV